MNRIIASYIINLFYSVLACWAFVEFYDFYIQFADIIKNESLTPVVLLFIVAIILVFFKRLHKKKYKKSSLRLYPLLFPQEDEHEKDITDRACRTTFVSLWFVLPCALGLLIFTPVANLYIPAYPLYVVYLIYLTQVTVFHISLYKNKLA
ncbi:RNA polymerase [Bacillus sp. TH22]|uniref:RNA polymerase n=1 Tax=unclassified Bacillus (in: firmicutes) TaxID=185979 RepID=UPI001912C8F7|nr:MULTISPECIES: RNA polymerase [unclassified Bacillus (in: firmicutes)]MBK5449358.1 RNA polymerase [Bacillus sp. TH22]MBK5456711.1 RNA polymerase [Bacillus sp. TH23]